MDGKKGEAESRLRYKLRWIYWWFDPHVRTHRYAFASHNICTSTIFSKPLLLIHVAHQLHHRRLLRCTRNVSQTKGMRQMQTCRAYMSNHRMIEYLWFALNNLSSSRLFVQDLWARPECPARPFACACLIPTSILPQQLPLPSTFITRNTETNQRTCKWKNILFLFYLLYRMPDKPFFIAPLPTNEMIFFLLLLLLLAYHWNGNSWVMRIWLAVDLHYRERAQWSCDSIVKFLHLYFFFAIRSEASVLRLRRPFIVLVVGKAWPKIPCQMVIRIQMLVPVGIRACACAMQWRKFTLLPIMRLFKCFVNI